MHHPAMAYVGPSRVELGTRTIFNLLGPLTNPARVKRQLTGAFSKDWIVPMAEVLGQLGSDRAWLVHGGDGTDEISIAGVTYLAELKDGKVSTREVHPEEAGLPTHPFESLIGGTPDDNAAAFRALMAGEKSPYRDAVLLNAAAGLVIADRVKTLSDGVAMAAESIDSGKALAKVEGLARITQSA